ncbi:MAG TPA: hypothetical protein VFF47_02570 [Nitrospirota bacterium]|nr:hypothetical protein [Nitrospirota bacterium]
MNSLNMTLNIITLVYGAVLIFAAFKTNRITETFRLDTFFTPRPTAATRMINLPAGLLAIGYTLYTMLK